MANMRIYFFILFGVFFLHTNAADKYTDENRPYEFGFTIDGEQHRHEKKDENGIIMGEFGFITADGVYHVTVYATDENGNFKILSMKNIRVKPYPTSPGIGAKKEYSSNYSSALKDSIPESTTAQKISNHQIASPAKSCSHCSLPPTTTLSPTFQKETLKSTNNHISASNNQNADSDKTKQIILPENRKYLQQSFDYQEQKDKLMPVSQITADRYPQSNVVSEGIPQNFNRGDEEQHNQHNNPMNTEQQKQNPKALLSNKEQNSPASPQSTSVSQTRHQDIPPNSRNLQGPIKEDNLSQKQSVVQNNQPLLETNNPLQDRLQEQQGNYGHKQINENFENNDSILPRTFNNEEQKGKLMPVSQITADIYPQKPVVTEGIPQTFNQGGEEYSNRLNNPMNTEQQKQQQEALLSKEEQNYPVAPQTASVSQPHNQNIPPISRNLQGPIKEDNLSQKQSVVQNNQPLLETNNPLQDRLQEQQGNYGHKQINENFKNNDSILPRTFNNEEQKGKLMPVSQITEDIYPQMPVVSEGIPQTFNQGGEEYSNQLNNPMNTEQQKQKQEALLLKEEQNYPVAPQTASVSQPHNQDIPPISRNLQGPIKENNLSQKQSVVQNNQPLLETNYSLQNQPQEQQGNYKQRNQINSQELPNYPNMYVTDHQTTEHDRPINYSKNKQPTQKVINADRNPKSFVNFIQQAEGPEDIAQTGPNLYRPSLPKPNTFSNKPELFAAQMQIVDKNTDVHHLNPGESVGLPTGLSKDDMSNLLYTFNYTVGFHGHHEKGYANGDKQGYYYVTGRNGVRTRVDYLADETGFHPKITQEILDILSDEVPKPETEKDEKFGLKGYEFKWLYFPVEKKMK